MGKSQILVINRVRVLRSGPHTPTQFFWEYPPRDQAKEFGLGSFDHHRLVKISGKTENYSISTQQQLDLELPLLLTSDGESELNGK